MNLLTAVPGSERHPLLRLRLHALAQALDGREHRHRWRCRRRAAAVWLGRRHRQPRRGAADHVRDHLPLDAAPLLGPGDQLHQRLRGRRRADAARSPSGAREARRRSLVYAIVTVGVSLTLYAHRRCRPRLPRARRRLRRHLPLARRDARSARQTDARGHGPVPATRLPTWRSSSAPWWSTGCCRSSVGGDATHDEARNQHDAWSRAVPRRRSASRRRRSTAPRQLVKTKTQAVADGRLAAAPPGGPVTVNIVAQNLAFNKRTITASAGVDVTVSLRQPGRRRPPQRRLLHQPQRHHPRSSTASSITGPGNDHRAASRRHRRAGNYFFRCDAHPDTMTGTFAVQVAHKLSQTKEARGSTRRLLHLCSTNAPTVVPTPGI